MPKIMRSERKDKKYKVIVKGKIIHFGDPNMRIKRNNPVRRKAFNSRFKCNIRKDKMSAVYWSCRAWDPRTKLP